jgi:hypothetical protein
MLAQNRQIAAKIEELENRLDKHDTDLQEIVQAIKELMTPPERSRARIGFNCHQSGKTDTARVQNVNLTSRTSDAVFTNP